MKSMYHLTFWSNKQKIDIFIKNHPHKVPYLFLINVYWVQNHQITSFLHILINELKQSHISPCTQLIKAASFQY